MPLFISFEGGEGSGKSTQIVSLSKKLMKLCPVVLTHEPGGTLLGEHIRNLLKWTDVDISSKTELLLFNASRAQLLHEIIKPSLETERIVICDRFSDSTLAYQGFGRGLNLEIVKIINDITTQGVKPNLTILLDISPEEAFQRIKNKQKDRFEKEEMAFHRKVREGYLALAAEEPQRWLVVDASQSKEMIKKIIWGKVSKLLPKRVKM